MFKRIFAGFVAGLVATFVSVVSAQVNNPGMTLIGAFTAGNCLKIVSRTTAQDSGGACGGGGGAVTSVFSRTGAVVAASGDYSVAQVTGAAPLASPTFTGTPAAPTAAAGDNSTTLATTAFVKQLGYLTANQTITLSGDCTGSGATSIVSTCGKINGNSVPSGIANNQLIVGTAANTTAFTTVPDCPSGTLQYTQATHTFACASGAGVTSFNSRSGVVVPVAGDYPVSKGGTGVTNCLGQIGGLQALKLSGSVVGVNPGTWCNNTGTAAFNNTAVMTADFSAAVPNFTPTPATGAQVSGALSPTSNATDGTEVFLYLIHRNSDGKTALIGSSSDTQGPNNQTFTATAAAPGVFTLGSAHGFRKRMAVYMSNSGGALPAPLGSGIQYYVCTVPSATTFTIATSIANVNSGSCLTLTTTGTGTNTVTWGVQPDIDFQLGSGVATFDRRLPYFSFVWSWSKYGSSGIPGGTNGIPDFQLAQGASDAIITNGGQATVFQALGAGTSSSWTAVDLSPWLSNLNRRALILTYCVFPSSAGGCYVRARGSGGPGIPVGTPNVATIAATGMWQVQTDSTTQIEYEITGGAQLSIYVLGWTQVDPS